MSTEYSKKPTWFWILVYLIVGGLLYAGIYYGYYAKQKPYSTSSQSTPASPTESKPEIGVKVEYTPTGFSPDTITISLGETVIWENTSSNTGNVSSDPHPVHTDYPPLNLGNLKSGKSFSLKFDQDGTYHYHNHLNQAQRGTVIVK